jgi:hypothetical protein
LLLASFANPKFYNDVLSRKMTFVVGWGTIHSDQCDISCWRIGNQLFGFFMIPYMPFLGEVFGANRFLPRLLTAISQKSVLIFLTASITACSTISAYDQTAYQQAVNTKVDALVLMDKAVEPYVNHRNDIAAFQTELQKAYEYERGRPLSKITLAQWDILRDPNRDLLGGFLKEWKQEGKLMPVYVERKKDQIGAAFDQIIQLESGKIKTAGG